MTNNLTFYVTFRNVYAANAPLKGEECRLLDARVQTILALDGLKGKPSGLPHRKYEDGRFCVAVYIDDKDDATRFRFRVNEDPYLKTREEAPVQGENTPLPNPSSSS